MIAVDTNILVYAHREDSSFHEKANRRLTELAESGQPWTIPWPCLHEFLAIITHAKIYKPPTPVKDALLQVDCWLESPTLHLIGESDGYWEIFKERFSSTQMTGPKVHDLRVAAVCLKNGVKALWSADRDFSRVLDLEIINPLG